MAIAPLAVMHLNSDADFWLRVVFVTCVSAVGLAAVFMAVCIIVIEARTGKRWWET